MQDLIKAVKESKITPKQWSEAFAEYLINDAEFYKILTQIYPPEKLKDKTKTKEKIINSFFVMEYLSGEISLSQVAEFLGIDYDGLVKLLHKYNTHIIRDIDNDLKEFSNKTKSSTQ